MQTETKLVISHEMTAASLKKLLAVLPDGVVLQVDIGMFFKPEEKEASEDERKA